MPKRNKSEGFSLIILEGKKKQKTKNKKQNTTKIEDELYMRSQTYPLPSS